MADKPFWQLKTLEQMSQEEWEALCDGCGKCCVILLEDDETDEIWETDVACKLFDSTCRKCSDYEARQRAVPGCVQLSPSNISGLKWMPESCAYKRLAQGHGLASWHPLLSGESESVVTAGVAVGRGLMSEEEVTEVALETHIVGRRWP